MAALMRSSTISLYREFVKCSLKIPRGVARERFVRNIHDLFVINQQFATPEAAAQLLQSGQADLIIVQKLFRNDPKIIAELFAVPHDDTLTKQIE